MCSGEETNDICGHCQLRWRTVFFFFFLWYLHWLILWLFFIWQSEVRIWRCKPSKLYKSGCWQQKPWGTMTSLVQTKQVNAQLNCDCGSAVYPRHDHVTKLLALVLCFSVQENKQDNTRKEICFCSQRHEDKEAVVVSSISRVLVTAGNSYCCKGRFDVLLR